MLLGGIAVVTLALGLGLGLGLKQEVLAAETPMVGEDYAADMPGESWNAVVMPGEEAVISGGGAEIRVPQGAVSTSTRVTLTQFTGPYEGSGFGQATCSSQMGTGEDEAVYAVSPVFDLGPAGTRFEKPTRVSIPYDESALPQGTSEDDVILAYFNGAEWIPLPTYVDKGANTASVELASFDGTILGAVAVGTALASVVVAGIVWWYGPEAVWSDPISEHTANTYIAPSDPVVADWAQRAALMCTPPEAPLGVTEGNPYVSLSASAEMSQFTSQAWLFGSDFLHTHRLELVYASGQNIVKDQWANSTNWIMPADYFNSNCVGDCTGSTNATVSVLINRGYRAKGVFGYSSGDPHVWVEVVFFDRPFIIDGKDVYPLDYGEAVLKLSRPGADDARNAMWDNNGQQPYVSQWWLQPGL